MLHTVPAPLHNGDRCVHGVLKIDVIDLRCRVQPVRVNMDQVRTTRPGAIGKIGVDPDQHERGRNDAGTDAQPLAESLGERRLACTQFAGQDQKIPGLQHLT
ncbi:hypothetical protein D3C73_1440240 [compost metagenome]